jgi:hypothetical protein
MEKKKKESSRGSNKGQGSGKEAGVSLAIREVRDDIKFSKRATELLGILIVVRLLVVLVVTPIQNMTWNRKNSFDVSHFLNDVG